MTGIFGVAARASVCVTLACNARIRAGEQVYFFRGLDRQAVCLTCAKSRWGYEPSNEPRIVKPASPRESIGFDSTRAILKKLQAADNANDRRLRQAGE